MLLSIDPLSERPIYEQIADSVRIAISAGSLRAGERLPSADEVAASLQVNKHTVLRAYQQLRDEGLVDLRRGRGAVVTNAGSTLSSLRAQAELIAAQAIERGVRSDTLIALVVDAYERTRAITEATEPKRKRL